MTDWRVELNALLMLSAALLSGCGSVSPQDRAAAHTEAAYAEQKFRAIEQQLRYDPSTGAHRFIGHSVNLMLADFQFIPRQIRLQSGTITHIRLSNMASVTHYFGGHEFFQSGAEVVSLLGGVVPPNQQHIPVPPFSERDIYLFVKDPGEYPLNCFVPSHRKAGMDGLLIVEPAAVSSSRPAVE